MTTYTIKYTGTPRWSEVMGKKTIVSYSRTTKWLKRSVHILWGTMPSYTITTEMPLHSSINNPVCREEQPCMKSKDQEAAQTQSCWLRNHQVSLTTLQRDRGTIPSRTSCCTVPQLIHHSLLLESKGEHQHCLQEKNINSNMKDLNPLTLKLTTCSELECWCLHPEWDLIFYQIQCAHTNPLKHEEKIFQTIIEMKWKKIALFAFHQHHLWSWLSW